MKYFLEIMSGVAMMQNGIIKLIASTRAAEPQGL